MNQQEEQKKIDNSSRPIILVVEDDKFLRDLVIQKLEKEGFETQAAIEAKDAFRLIEEKTPQLILLDLVLPGMDGFSMMRKLKESPETAGIPVIILSNLGQKEDVERAMSDGAVDYMVKANFTPGEIVDRIRAVLRKNS